MTARGIQTIDQSCCRTADQLEPTCCLKISWRLVFDMNEKKENKLRYHYIGIIDKLLQLTKFKTFIAETNFIPVHC